MSSDARLRGKLALTSACFVLLCLATAALISGHPTLSATAVLGVPNGQWLTIAGLLAGPVAGLIASRPATGLRRWSSTCGIAAAAWLPIGTYLAGNVSLNFFNNPVVSMWFWRYTGAVALASLVLAIAALTVAARSRNAP